MMSQGRWLVTICLVLGISACAPKPTRTREEKQVPKVKITKDMKAEKATWLRKVQKDECALLDSRSLYEFQLKRVPGSVLVRWQDFANPGESHKGILSKDLQELAERLALIGVAPNRCAVIFTDRKSVGADGRLAWTLAFLGVKEIQILNREDYPELFVGALDKATRNLPAWKPNPQQNLRTTAADFVKSQPEMFVVLDIRSPEQQKLNPISRFWSGKALELEANKLFERNRFKTESIWLLEKMGISQDQPLVVVSRDGVMSAGVSFYLTQIGYRASNLEAGYDSLSK